MKALYSWALQTYLLHRKYSAECGRAQMDFCQHHQAFDPDQTMRALR
jgi:hypothetical protein